MKKIKYISILLLTLLVTIGFRMDVRGGQGDYADFSVSKDDNPEFHRKLLMFFGSRQDGAGKEMPGSCSLFDGDDEVSSSQLFGTLSKLSDFDYESYDCLSVGSPKYDITGENESGSVSLKTIAVNVSVEKGSVTLTALIDAPGWFAGLWFLENPYIKSSISYELETDKFRYGKVPDAIVFQIDRDNSYITCPIAEANDASSMRYFQDEDGKYHCIAQLIKKDNWYYKLVVAETFYLDDEGIDGDSSVLEQKVEEYVSESSGNRFAVENSGRNKDSKNKYDQCVEDYGYELDPILDISKKIKNFDLLDDLLTKNHNGGYGISSIDVKRNLENFLKQSEYYTKNKDANAISEAIKTDCEKVDKFVQENKLFNCLNDNYHSTDGVYRYKNKNSDFKGTYVYSLQDFCKYSDEENVSDLLNGMEIDDQQSRLIENYSDKCSGYAGPDSAVEAQKNVCLNKEITEDIEKINCDKLGSGEFDSEEESINELMKYMYWYSSEYKCKGSNKLDLCIKSYCTEIQSDPKSIAQEIINGATPEQEKADNIYNSLYNNLYESKTIELKFGSNELCSRIKMLEDYLKGGLNLIRIAGPIITIILTIMDGMKTFASFKDDESKKFFNRLYKRLICIAILFLVPTIIYFLLGFIMPIDEVCKI